MEPRTNPNSELINKSSILNTPNVNANLQPFEASSSFYPFSDASFPLAFDGNGINDNNTVVAHTSSSSSSDVYSEADDDIVEEDISDDNYIDSDDEERRANYYRRAAKMATASKQQFDDGNESTSTSSSKRGRKPRAPGEPPRPRGPPRGPRGPYKPRKLKDPSMENQSDQLIARTSKYYNRSAINPLTNTLSYDFAYRYPAFSGLPPQAIVVPMPGPNGTTVMVPYLPASMITSQGTYPGLWVPPPFPPSQPKTSVENITFPNSNAQLPMQVKDEMNSERTSIPFTNNGLVETSNSNSILPIPIITTPSGLMVSTVTGELLSSNQRHPPLGHQLLRPQYQAAPPLTFSSDDGLKLLSRKNEESSIKSPVQSSERGKQNLTNIPSSPRLDEIEFSNERIVPSLVKDRARRIKLKSVDYSTFDKDNIDIEAEESTKDQNKAISLKKQKQEKIPENSKVEEEHTDTDDLSDNHSEDSGSEDYPYAFVEKILAVSINENLITIEDAIKYNDTHALLTPGSEHPIDGMRLLSLNLELPSVIQRVKDVSKKNLKIKVTGTQLFLVKLVNRSYLHTEWVSKDLLLSERGGNIRYYRFLNNPSNLTPKVQYFDEDYLKIDRILDIYIEHIDPQDEAEIEDSTTVAQSPSFSYPIQVPPIVDGRRSFFIKWKGISIDAANWEYEETILEKYPDTSPGLIEQFLSMQVPSARKIAASKRLIEAKNSNAPIPRPSYSSLTDTECDALWGVLDRQLRLYQREGIDWLSFCWTQRQPCIIADEMGLGKTIQAVAFLARLSSDFFGQIPGPFFIVCPLSCVPHWERELNAWAPSLSILTYQGKASERESLYEYDFWYKDEQKNLLNLPGVTKFDVLLASYEMAISGISHLRSVPFRIGIFDEAHRLKNRSSRMAEILSSFRIEHKILLTGTPLQNSIEELFALLSFIQPWRFSDEARFLAEYGKMERPEDVAKIQALLRPLMLRRLKEDVEASIPLREETIIEVALSPVQKRYYRAILERNLTYLAGGGGGSTGLSSLANAMIELRKVCMHPFLIEGAEEALTTGGVDYAYVMTHVSSKLLLVDKLLKKLRNDSCEKHRVLIFSQMTRMLDLMEILLEAREYPWERIDGRVRGELRQAAIDRFCDPNRDAFVFLLCTRAGGVGINLTPADTVIIYDSDWNPQNDLQAMARCHRIGQTRSVKVYRLICTGTYEQEMLERAGLKLGLDRAILQRMPGKNSIEPTSSGSVSSFSRREIEHLLKKGAYGAIFNDDELPIGSSVLSAETSPLFTIPEDEEDIDIILERRTRVITHSDGTTNDVQHTLDNKKGRVEVGSSIFSKASFAPSKSNFGVDVDDPNFWTLWARHVRGGDGLKEDSYKEIIGPLEEDERRFKRQTRRLLKEHLWNPNENGIPALGLNSNIISKSISEPITESVTAILESQNNFTTTANFEDLFLYLCRFGLGRSKLISKALDEKYSALFIQKVTKNLLEHILSDSSLINKSSCLITSALNELDKNLIPDSISLLLMINDEDIKTDTDASINDEDVIKATNDIISSVKDISVFGFFLLRCSLMRLVGRIIDLLYSEIPRKGKKSSNLPGHLWLDDDLSSSLSLLGITSASLRSKTPSKSFSVFATALSAYDWPSKEHQDISGLPNWWQIPLHDAALLLSVWIHGLGSTFEELFSDRKLFSSNFSPNNEKDYNDDKLERRFRIMVVHISQQIETKLLKEITSSEVKEHHEFNISLPASTRSRKQVSITGEKSSFVKDDPENDELFLAVEEDDELYIEEPSTIKIRSGKKRTGTKKHDHSQVVDDDTEFGENKSTVVKKVRKNTDKTEKRPGTRMVSPRIRMKVIGSPY